MIERNKALEFLNKGLKQSTAEQTEIVLLGEDLSLTRFAESQIHQNLYRSEANIFVRAITDGKIGIASTTSLSDDALAATVKSACDISSLMIADDKFSGLPSGGEIVNQKTFFKNTAEFSPTQRAEAVKLINSKCQKHSLKAAGAFETTTETLAVVNSQGVEQYYNGTFAQLSMTTTGEKGNSGWSIGYDRDVDKIKVSALADQAVEKAASSLDPISLESGEYTVILEPAAVGQLLLFLGFMGFGGKTLVQHRSFMAGKIGEKITGNNITIIEDPLNLGINGIPFDYEGVPRKKVTLVENGIAKGVVYNSYYANLAGVESTGHALPPNNGYGPYPKHMIMSGGNATMDEMIGSIERGVYITHFWYINFLNPMRTQVTGTTRDGTFLIENGKISKPIKNMRISPSILETYANAEMISKENFIYPQYSVVMKVPAMKVVNFKLENIEK